MASGGRIVRITGVGLVILGIKYILPLMVVSAQVFQNKMVSNKWRPATATWYGAPDGFGSDGGACGYGALVGDGLIRSRSGAVSPAMFLGGEGCGACYKVKCLDTEVCARRAVTIIVTDECPGGPCANGDLHFDLGGAAYSRMARPGEGGLLRDRGLIQVIFKRTPCTYHGRNIAFHINEGSTPYWLSLLVEFEDGDGDIEAMYIKAVGSREWLKMSHVWGATYSITGMVLQPPLSVKLTTLSTNSTLIAANVIPIGWGPTATYYARGLNFHV